MSVIEVRTRWSPAGNRVATGVGICRARAAGNVGTLK
jgi:hypothetical protein